MVGDNKNDTHRFVLSFSNKRKRLDIPSCLCFVDEANGHKNKRPIESMFGCVLLMSLFDIVFTDVRSAEMRRKLRPGRATSAHVEMAPAHAFTRRTGPHVWCVHICSN